MGKSKLRCNIIEIKLGDSPVNWMLEKNHLTVIPASKALLKHKLVCIFTTETDFAATREK